MVVAPRRGRVEDGSGGLPPQHGDYGVLGGDAQGYMRLIEGYFFRQLLGPTIAASLALGGVAVLSQSLSSLDLLVDQRQNILVFLRIVLLSLPELLALVLPIAVFVAALMALNRLHIEQEIVVCFAAGMSRWRVIAPAVKLATLAALLTLVVNLWVDPWAAREMRRERRFSIAPMSVEEKERMEDGG